jgi:hypothetical protein
MEANSVGSEYAIGDNAVLTFELKGVQAAIKKSVLMRANGLNELVDREVQSAFSEERILESVRKQVQHEFEYSMKYGAGAEAVRKIVEKQVSKTISKLVVEE